METCNKILSLLQQNRTGIKISAIARKLHIDPSTVYRCLNTMDLKASAHFERGTAYLEKASSVVSNSLDYSDMEPSRALKVARIDWLLTNVDWDDKSLYGNNELEQLVNYVKYGSQYGQTVKKALELLRDLWIREGKALGSNYRPPS